MLLHDCSCKDDDLITTCQLLFSLHSVVYWVQVLADARTWKVDLAGSVDEGGAGHTKKVGVVIHQTGCTYRGPLLLLLLLLLLLWLSVYSMWSPSLN
jgi:hypothetical protein